MKLNTEGAEELIKTFEKLSASSQRGLLKRVLYPAAGVMADAMKEAVESLPVATAKEDLENLGKDRKSHLRQYEKDGLLEGLGIAPMKDISSGFNTSVGFHGYNSRGKSNAMIARSLDKGTSFMPADKTISRAESRARKAVVQAMADELDKAIDEMAKGG